MVPAQFHSQQAARSHNSHNRPQLPRLQSKFEKLRHVHSSPLYAHHEEEDVECGSDMQCCDTEQSFCTRQDHHSGACICPENSPYQRKVTSLERRVRVGGWVAMMVLLLLTACFVIRELLVNYFLSLYDLPDDYASCIEDRVS
jgi:hypothetical protein